MKTEHDKAVALAEKHGYSCDGRVHTFTVAQLAAMLAERDKQHTEELAQRSEAMPAAVMFQGVDGRLCREPEVREAIASLEAKSTWHKEMADSFADSLKQSEARLERTALERDMHARYRMQSEARVRELEKDAARWEWVATHPNRFEDYYEEAFHSIPSSKDFVEKVKAFVTKKIDAAINKESGK